MTNLITIPFVILETLTSFVMPKHDLELPKEQKQVANNLPAPGLSTHDFTIKMLSEYDASFDARVDAYGQTFTQASDKCTITYTYVNQVYEYDGENHEILKQDIYFYLEITPYITYKIKNIRFYDNLYAADTGAWYINEPKNVPNYKVADSILHSRQQTQIYQEGQYLDYQLPVGQTTKLLYIRTTTNPSGWIQVPDNYNYMNTKTLTIYYEKDANVVINNDIIDLPGLLWEILAMPFAFISQAFNLTLFPGTQYSINIANTLMVFLGILILFAILKIVLKIFL